MRGLKAAVLVILGATLATDATRAQEPCEGCTIPPVWISPESSHPYDVYFLPLEDYANVEVTIRFPPVLCDLLVLCDRPYSACETSCDGISFVDTTEFALNPSTKRWEWRARFHIQGGGCWDEELMSEPAHLAQIYVDGELVRRVGVRSPDVVSNTGVFPWDLWCQAPPSAAGSSVVDMSDAVFLSRFIRYGTYEPCADVNGDGVVNLTDAVVIAPAVRAGSWCGEW